MRRADAGQAVVSPLPGGSGAGRHQRPADASATSKSAVSRRFVARTEHALAELLAADLSGLHLVALLVDGVRVAEHCCVVALGITIDGTKIPLGLVEGATENAAVVLDGAKALCRAVNDVFDHPVVQRCQLHKLRNVADRLPDAVASNPGPPRCPAPTPSSHDRDLR
jgi:putative transposase